MELYSDEPIDWNFGLERDIQETMTTAENTSFASELKADCAMAILKRTAALAAWSAEAGPCTTENGPCTPGNRKIASTERTASTATSHPIRRPDIMEVLPLIIS